MTVCTQDRACLFGDILDGQMRLNEFGGIVAWTWQDLPNHVPNVALDAFVLMPNHVHGIVVITDTVGAGSEPAPTEPAPTNTKRYALPEIVRQFKTFSARRINKCRGTPGAAVWQRNYYERILRSEESLNQVRQYILDNPHRWAYDRENPEATALEPEAAWAQ